MNRLNDLKMILENASVQCITDAKTYTEQKDRYNAVMEYVNSLEQNEPIGKWIPCKVGDEVYKILEGKVVCMKAVAIPLLISSAGAHLSVTSQNRRGACISLEVKLHSYSL